MKPAILMIACAALSACTGATLDTYRPVVDAPRTSAKYEFDLAQCTAIAREAEAGYKRQQDEQMGANLIGGLLLGALVGAAVGGNGDWAAYGAAHGAAQGVASTDTELAHGGPRRIIDRCMIGRGHRVLSDLGRGVQQ